MFLEPCPFCPAEFVASDPLGAETMLGHHVLIGQVVKASFDAGLDPLLYFRGRYRRLHFD